MTDLLELVARVLASLYRQTTRLGRVFRTDRLAAAVRREILKQGLRGSGADVVVGAGLRVGRRVAVRVGRGANVLMGDEVVLGDDVYVHVFPGATLVLGDRVHINTHARISAFKKVEIGDDTGLAAFSAIHDHHHRFDLESRWEKHGYEGQPVIIGKGVAILARVAITSGVTIGDYSVIGANSVVTRDVPASTFCAGVPARVIRRAGDETG